MIIRLVLDFFQNITTRVIGLAFVGLLVVALSLRALVPVKGIKSGYFFTRLGT